MNKAKFLLVGTAMALSAMSAPVLAQGKAGGNNSGPTACSLTDFANAEACSGFFAGNLLSNNNADIQAQISGLAAIGYTFNGNWNSVASSRVLPLGDRFTYDFASALNKTTFIGIHKGKGGANGVEGTAFYRLNANNLDTIRFNLNGGSSAVLYSTGMGAVPEPATWALLMLGFAGVGASMRQRKDRREVRVRYA